MALHRLLGIEIGVPEPARLESFYREIGLQGGGGKWGCAGLPGQIEISESPYRQLRQLRVACADEAELAAIAARLDALGVAAQVAGGALRLVDPLNHWRVVVEPAPPFDIAAPPPRVLNRSGARPRTAARADVVVEESPRPPRRLGHFVIGTPHIEQTLRFFVDGLGFRISDSVAGVAFFLRCSFDHHNLLIQPGPVPYLNHYAFEHDDVDAVARAASVYVRAHPDAHVDGLGRHMIGSNVFWYMRDPCGTFFEFFTDMDAIPDDTAWQARDDWALEGTWSVWGSREAPEVFFQPADLDSVVAGFHEENK